MILITGNNGYIGAVLSRYLKERACRVAGLDCNYYRGCDFYTDDIQLEKQIVKDIRDVEEKDMEGVTAIVHLAALSNDPLGEINPELTMAINHNASVRLAKMAKNAGIERFIFSSSCSVYGIASGDIPITEETPVNPVTSYAKAKVTAEREISRLASDNFHPVVLRNATVYGLSPRMRLDLVVNNLVAWGFLTGRVLVKSDGAPWRPIIHVEDLCQVIFAMLEAPAEKIHNQVFNVGINSENFQIRDIANRVANNIHNCQVEIRKKSSPDERSYQVDFSKLRSHLPRFEPRWDLTIGITELYKAYKAHGLSQEDFDSDNYFRVRRIKKMISERMVDKALRLTDLARGTKK